MNTPTRPDTRHLDTAISILGGGKAPRKPMTKQVHLIDLGNVWAVQVNHKVVAQFADKLEARADAERRAAKINASVLEY
ncbi:MAG: hypothetical protein JZU64_00610 [Rhodoferax sp.]|nr:hypothetical protein [Rhodoferax sp.]